MKSGEFDHVEIYLGRRGSGKSTGALEDLVKLQRELKCYAVGHDAASRVPRTLLSGKPAPIVHWDSTDAALAAVRRAPHLIHLVRSPNADDALDLALKLSALAQERLGDAAPPVVCLIDEGVLSTASPRYLPDNWREFQATCRHHNVGIKLAVQNPKFVHYTFFEMSTAVHLYRIKGSTALAFLREQAIPDDVIARLPALERGERITIADEFDPSKAGKDKEETTSKHNPDKK